MKTALLVIDTQKSFKARPFWSEANFPAWCRAQQRLIEGCVTRHIPVIICTTKGQEADRAWGLRQGAVAYLVKPIDETALLAAIRSME